MKKLVLALSVIIFSASVTAQDKPMASSKNVPHLGFGVDVGVPLGINHPIFNFVIGGDLQVDYKLADHLLATASLGFDARLYKGGIVKTDYYVPLLGGLRYFVTNKIFLSEQAGYSFKATTTLQNAFTDVAGIGYKPTSKSDILVGYKGLFYSGGGATFSTLAVRVAYNFGK